MHPKVRRLHDLLDETILLHRGIGDKGPATWLEKAAGWIRDGDLYGVEFLRRGAGGMGSCYESRGESPSPNPFTRWRQRRRAQRLIRNHSGIGMLCRELYSEEMAARREHGAGGGGEPGA